MKKTNFTYLIISTCAMIILSIIFISYISVKNNEQESKKIAEKVTDECTEDWEEYTASLVRSAQANSKENVVSPNTKMVFKEYYKSCGHEEVIEQEVSEEVVNMYEEQIKEKYSDYQIQEFSKDQISLYKEKEGLCDKHYLLIEEEGYLAIYKLENSGEKELMSKTNISSEYLTDVDNIQLKQGIYVYGLDELNKALEDFE